MDIQRNDYVEQIASKSWNGKVKIVTGIRRCGKSYLLSHLYKQYLLQQGVEKDCFVEIDLEPKSNIAYRNPNTLYDYVMSRCQDKNRKYYVFIDEIQLCYKVKSTDIDESLVTEEDRELLYTTFYDILNGLRTESNMDVYVTGSNSKMLSTDIVTNFRDRGSEIKVYPLSFAEYYAYSGLEKPDALEQYLLYGGMPLAVYGGRSEIMSMISPDGPVYQAGTLSGNPIAVAAGIATLKKLKANPTFYMKLLDNSQKLQQGLTKAANDVNLNVVCNRYGAMMTIFFNKEPVTDYETAKKSDTALFARWFKGMLERKIYLAPSQFEAIFISGAHTETDINRTITAAKEVFAML